jgi:hypothetical protein
MATIYRFIVEQRASVYNGGTTTPRASKGAGKKGKNLPLFGFGNSRGGVHSNRKLRAINPIFNKVTNGVWEKGMRLTRAGMGLVRRNTETGKLTFSGTSIAIIIAFVLITVWNGIAKWNARERANAAKLNAQNFKAMENGSGTVHGAYSIAVNGWSGHITYNENK